VPEAAAGLLDRIESAHGEVVELRAPGDAPELGHLLTARPGCEGDVWTVTVDPLPEDPAGDARLRELNHRVLNSLAMLSSIIGIESRALDDHAGRAALERVRSRLVAVSNLYRILSAANSGATIRADIYLRSVADAVAASVGLSERIALSVDAAPCALTTSQAASVGLITNEAMTNAYKHAFSGRRDGRITVALTEEDGALLLCISDNGSGIPDGARSGLGTTLVEALAVDLSGSVSVSSGDWGTSVQVTFPAHR
jgi:chemotaxis protein methyltransferase CheR